MKHRWIVTLLLLPLLLLSLVIPGLAADPVSLTIDYGDNAFAKAPVRIYQIATMDETYAPTLTTQFAKYPLNFRKDMSNAYELGQTLSGYIALDDIKPFDTATTNKKSILSVDQLPWGIYLVELDDCVVGGIHYSAQPTLLTLPYDDGSGTHNTHVDIRQKVTHVTPSKSLNVVKLWDDKGHESNRPESITVALLQNGKVTDTVTLSQNNNWKYTWSNLNANAKWQVVETDVPAGYIVSNENVIGRVEITNTFKEPHEKDKEKEKEDDDEVFDIPEEDVPLSDVPNAELPYTGLVTWPITLLAGLGLLFLCLGLFLLRSKGKDSHE